MRVCVAGLGGRHEYIAGGESRKKIMKAGEGMVEGGTTVDFFFSLHANTIYSYQALDD